MENLPTSISFKIAYIDMPQFAILDPAPDLNNELSFNAQFSINAVAKDRVIQISVYMELTQVDKRFVVIEVRNGFSIDENSWETLKKQHSKVIEFPKQTATHFLVLAVGTLRGALFAKTQNTAFTRFPLPPLNISEIFKEDIALDISET